MVEVVIPAGMVAYGPEHPDYPNEPQDWDRGVYMCRDGKLYHMAGYGWQHGYGTYGKPASYDRIAYTPRADVVDTPLNTSPVVDREQGFGVTQSERERVARIIDPDAFYRKAETLAGRNPGWAIENVQACCERALAKADAILATVRAGGEVERLRELVARARLNVPEFYLNWHHDARAALAAAAGGEGL